MYTPEQIRKFVQNQYYPERKDCKCENLEDIWGQIRKIDGLAELCTEDAKVWRLMEGAKEDKVFEYGFKTHIKEWIESMKEYGKLLENKIFDNHVNVKKRGKVISRLRFALGKKLSQILHTEYKGKFFCGYCDTQIPFLSYEGFKFE